MSLQKARERFYSSRIESDESSDWSDEVYVDEEFIYSSDDSSEEVEYFVLPRKSKSPVNRKKQAENRLVERLERIKTEFKQAAPSVVAAKKFHIQKPVEESPDVVRFVAAPIQEVLIKPTVTKCANVARNIGLMNAPEQIEMTEDQTAINYANFVEDVGRFSNGEDFVCISTSSNPTFNEDPPVQNEDVVIQIDELDSQFGVPPEDDFHEWVTDKFGQENVPQYDRYISSIKAKKEEFNPEEHEEAQYSDEESWGEWPESNNWPTATDEMEECDYSNEEVEPNPMDMKGNRIAKKLAGLNAELKKIEENKNVLLVEKESLVAQLKACKKRIEELGVDHDSTTVAIELTKGEQAQHIAELDKLSSRKERENELIAEIRQYMDEFSQAVQILLNYGKYWDFEQLIRAHVKDGVYIGDSVKSSIIREAKILKRDALYATMETTNCSLCPKNEDGLPNLYDQYITDSYNIIED